MLKNNIENLSDSELKALYQEKKLEYDKNKEFHEGIRRLIQNKIEAKEKIIKELENKFKEEYGEKNFIDFILKNIDNSSNVFEYDPRELLEELNNLQNKQTELQLRYINEKKTLIDVEKQVQQQKIVESELIKEIEDLITKTKGISEHNDSESDKNKFDGLIKEYQLVEKKLKAIHNEIERLSNKIYRKG